jgi:hypothetical protein
MDGTNKILVLALPLPSLKSPVAIAERLKIGDGAARSD